MLSLILFLSCGDTQRKGNIHEDKEEEGICYIETIPYPYQYPREDSLYINLEVYEMSNRLSILLDSILGNAKGCSKLEGERSIFEFHAYHDYDGYPIIVISTTLPYKTNPISCKGVFFYRDFKFFYKGYFVRSLFKHTERRIEHRGVRESVFMSDIDDSELYWRYLNENNRFIALHGVNCNGFWLNENYKSIRGH